MLIPSKYKLYIAFLVCLSLTQANPSNAQQVMRGPYLQIGTPTSIVVRWRTDVQSDSRVMYGQNLSDLSWSVVDTTLTNEHELTLSGLVPNTKYYYSVGTELNVITGGDSTHYFITSPHPDSSKSTRIWILGDAGTKTGNQRAVRDAYYNFTGDRHTDLWLMLGDNAYKDGEDSEYQLAVFDMYAEMLRKSVLWPARGNHDRGPLDTSGNWTNGGTYYDIFTLPTAGEAGGLASGTEAYYSFNYGNIHFICMESTLQSFRADNSAMLNWLRDDLNLNDKLWTIAFWHHPPYTKGSHNSNSESALIEMRERALPILEAAGVDLVLGGHSHSYERSFMINGHYDKSWTFADSMIVDGGKGQVNVDSVYIKSTTGLTPNKGTVYIVAGSSGKTSGGSGFNHPVMVYSQRVLGSVVLDISGRQLDEKFLDSAGAIRDYFTIVKPGNTVGIPEQLVMIDGDQQIAPVDSTLLKPFEVEVQDKFLNPVGGIPVTFAITSGEGSLSNQQPQITDENGRAQTTLTLGSIPDTITVTATALNLKGSPQIFQAIAVADSVPVIIIQPVTYDYGEVVILAGLAKTFIIKNSGTLNLEVPTINLINGDVNDFKVTSGFAPFTLIPGDSHEVEINFTPTSEGVKSTTLRIESNDMKHTPLDVILSGTGIISQLANPILPRVSTSPTPGDADDPAIWIHPTDPSRSVVIGTDKTNGIYVWDLNGQELQNIPQGTNVNNVDVRQNVNFGGQIVDIVAANLRDIGKLAIFKVNPDYTGADVLSQIANKDSLNNDIQKNSYGFCLYKRKTDSTLFVFERPKNRGAVRQYRIDDNGTGNGVVVAQVRDLDYNGGIAEGFVADDELGFVYITEEDFGIHKYLADPDSATASSGFFATGDGTASDREGVAIYACKDGTGYLVLSSQGNSTIKIYERQGNNKFLKTITPLDDKGNSGLGSDGLDVTAFSAPPNFPDGFLVVHDQGGTRFHLYDWSEVAANELTICPDSVKTFPQIFVESTEFDFGEVDVDSSVVKIFFVKNIGSASLVIQNITLSGNDSSDFKIESGRGPFTINTNDSLAVVVDFIPKSEGAKSTILRFESNDPAHNPLDLQLSGRGKAKDPVSVETMQSDLLPERFALKQNYPNPFNAETTIEYALPVETHVRIVIYNLLGEKIKILVDKFESAGLKRLRWNGTDKNGRVVGSGIYYVLMVAGNQKFMTKMMLLK